MRFLLTVAILFGAITLAAAGGTKIRALAEPEFDFGIYSTYAWGKGTPALYLEIQERIVASVEHELEARGLTKATPATAQLIVSTFAFAELGMETIGRSFWGAHWGLIRVDVNEFKKGLLWIKVTDRVADRPVWQALVGKVVTGAPEKIVPRIDGIVQRMFETKPTPKLAEKP